MEPLFEIQIKGYCSLLNATLPLQEGITVITGPSNVGKSSLIKAIQQTLYNQSGSTYINNLLSKCETKLLYKGHEIKFSRKVNGSVKYEIDGSLYDKVTGQPEIISSIGFTEGGLTTSDELNFWEQSTLPFLIHSSPKDRYEILSNGVQGLEEIRLMIQFDLKSLKDEIETNTVLLRSLEADVERLSNLVIDEEVLNELNEALVKFNLKVSSYFDLLEKLTKISTLTKELEPLKVKLGKLKQVNLSSDVLNELEVKIGNLEVLKTCIGELASEARELQDLIDTHKCYQNGRDELVSKLNEELKGVCPLCGNKLNSCIDFN